MTTLTSGVRVPVPAVAPKGPVLSLLNSSVSPPDIADFEWSPDPEQMAALPHDLQMEIKARSADLWTFGITYEPENQSAAVNRAPNDRTTVDDPTQPPNEAIVMYDPFAITTKYSCSPWGWEANDFKGKAERQNDIASHAAVGLEFWDGAIAQSVGGCPNNYLTKAGMSTILNPTLGTAVSITDGLALLQDALRQGLGGQGMIHSPAGSLPSLVNVRRVGKFMLDEVDNIVVPDPGYSGNGPIGATHATPEAGKSWIFATDLVMTRIQAKARIFPDTMSEALERDGDNVNYVTFRAERLAMAYFDGFRQFAVYVNLPS